VSSSSAHRIGTKRPEGGAISGGAIREIAVSMGRTNEGRRYLINTHAPEITNHMGGCISCSEVNLAQSLRKDNHPLRAQTRRVFLCVLEGANRLGIGIRSTHTAISGENCRHGVDSTTDKVRGIIPLQWQTADSPRRLSPCVITYG
jgi:hypothetical protein